VGKSVDLERGKRELFHGRSRDYKEMRKLTDLTEAESLKKITNSNRHLLMRMVQIQNGMYGSIDTGLGIRKKMPMTTKNQQSSKLKLPQLGSDASAQ
jgi:hypothetical protein